MARCIHIISVDDTVSSARDPSFMWAGWKTYVDQTRKKDGPSRGLLVLGHKCKREFCKVKEAGKEMQMW